MQNNLKHIDFAKATTMNRLKLHRQLSRKLSKRPLPSVTPSMEDLICGIPIKANPYIDGDYCGLIDRLRSDLSALHPQIQIAVGINAALPASAIFPFLARKFLELSLTSLLARIDPLRVIAARKNQMDSSFEPGRQNTSSVTWTGDIFSKETPPSGNTWSSTVLKKGIERSVLGWHYSEVAIAPGLRWLTDADNSKSEWLRQLSDQEKPYDWIKGRLAQLYSTLSKGVHAEYLLDDSTEFDSASIQQHMQDCYMLVLLLATASHISPLFARSLSAENALLAFRRIENQLVIKDIQ